nr:hypothetical protein [Tanacetum cinerariifolium]
MWRVEGVAMGAQIANDIIDKSPQYGSVHPTQHYSTTYPSIPHAITYPSTPQPNVFSSTIHQDACTQPQSIPQIKYTMSIVNQQTDLAKFPQIDSDLAVYMFKQGDAPINAINKMMSFLSIVISPRFLTTNYQLRNSSNPRQQATIHDGRVTVQPVQGGQSSFAAGNSRIRANILGIGRNNSGQQRIMKCFNCQGEGPVTQTIITHNAAYQADDLEAYDSDCDDFSTANAVLIANFSSYELDVLSEVPHSKNTHIDLLNQSVQEMSYSEQTHLVII